MAKQLNVSPATIRRRIRTLLQSQLRIVAVADHNKIGLTLAAVIALDVAHDKLESVTQFLISRPEVTWLSTTTGRFDVILLARFGRTDELSDFLHNELAQLEGLKNSETFVCLKVKQGLIPTAAF